MILGGVHVDAHHMWLCCGASSCQNRDISMRSTTYTVSLGTCLLCIRQSAANDWSSFLLSQKASIQCLECMKGSSRKEPCEVGEKRKTSYKHEEKHKYVFLLYNQAACAPLQQQL